MLLLESDLAQPESSGAGGTQGPAGASAWLT
jgi:hypothetical protein